MWLAASILAGLLVAPHLLTGANLAPAAGIGLWWSVLVLRAALAILVVVIVLLFVPASGLFELLTGWCLHAVVPLLTSHLGLSGHRLGDAAVLVPAFVVAISAVSAALGAWRAARRVGMWLTGNVIGPGPENSVLVADSNVFVAVAGLRDPQVVISAGALRDLDDAELKAGLQHEWGHVLRRHRFFSLSSHLFSAASRLLPGGRTALRNLNFHLERDADQYALRSTDDPLALASAICKVVHSNATPGGIAMVGLAGSGTPERLRILLSDPRPVRPFVNALVFGLAAAAIAATVVVVLALPGVAHAGFDLNAATPFVACN